MTVKNFWHQSDKPLLMLAPMEDVTDTTFREIILSISTEHHLHTLFCEFMNTDGFCHPIGRERVAQRLKTNNSEIQLLKTKNVALVAQIWGTNPEHFHTTAKYISENTPFNGIDINMGCPMKNITKKGACSALIEQPELAKEIILATQEATNLPVSVKTRIGIKDVITEKWIAHLLSTSIDGLTIHGRTQKMMSTGMADWSEIKKAATIAHSMNSQTKIIGNGDIQSLSEAKLKINDADIDGAMIGRGIFNNPWFFNDSEPPTDATTRLHTLLKHAELFHETWNTTKPWNILKRFFKIYTHNLPAAAQLRDQLMHTKDIVDLNKVVSSYLNQLQDSSIR